MNKATCKRNVDGDSETGQVGVLTLALQNDEMIEVNGPSNSD